MPVNLNQLRDLFDIQFEFYGKDYEAVTFILFLAHEDLATCLKYLVAKPRQACTKDHVNAATDIGCCTDSLVGC